METGLITTESLNPIEVFVGEGIDHLLHKIEVEVGNHNPDTTTAKGRKEIASLSHKVSKSKVILDNLGKELVSDWKAKSKKVDESRKKSRDFLDSLRDKVRQPLTEWEEAEAARLEQERLKKEIEEAHDLALKENELFDRQKEIEAREAEHAKREEERKAKELAEQKERERLENEERIRQEAIEATRREAEKKAQEEREAAERRIREEKERADRAEMERLAAIKRAEDEKHAAIQKAKEDAEKEAKRKEDERIRVEAEKSRREAEEREEAERKARNKEHRRKINVAAAEAMTVAEITLEEAKKIVKMIASGEIPNVTIKY